MLSGLIQTIGLICRLWLNYIRLTSGIGPINLTFTLIKITHGRKQIYFDAIVPHLSKSLDPQECLTNSSATSHNWIRIICLWTGARSALCSITAYNVCHASRVSRSMISTLHDVHGWRVSKSTNNKPEMDQQANSNIESLKVVKTSL